MRRYFPVFALSLLLVGCQKEESKSSDTTTADPPRAEVSEDPPPPEEPVAQAVASISSARLTQDCPDPEEAAKPDAKSRMAPKSSKSKRKGDSAGPFMQPCSQSNMQIAFKTTQAMHVGQTGHESRVAIREVRLLSAEGKPLSTISARMPTVWQEGGYTAWNRVLLPGQDLQVSYKLGLPDWSAVEATTGASSFGPMYVLEVELELAGDLVTILSPQFERGRAEIVKT